MLGSGHVQLTLSGPHGAHLADTAHKGTATCFDLLVAASNEMARPDTERALNLLGTFLPVEQIQMLTAAAL